MPSNSNKPKKRKPRRSAVLQFRVHDAEYREIAKAAAKLDITIAKEAARRLFFYRVWEEAGAATRLLYREGYSLPPNFPVAANTGSGLSEAGASGLTASQLETLLVEAARRGADLALKEFEEARETSHAGKPSAESP
jgi:hypothetical protein